MFPGCMIDTFFKMIWGSIAGRNPVINWIRKSMIPSVNVNNFGKWQKRSPENVISLLSEKIIHSYLKKRL